MEEKSQKAKIMGYSKKEYLKREVYLDKCLH